MQHLPQTIDNMAMQATLSPSRMPLSTVERLLKSTFGNASSVPVGLADTIARLVPSLPDLLRALRAITVDPQRRHAVLPLIVADSSLWLSLLEAGITISTKDPGPARKRMGPTSATSLFSRTISPSPRPQEIPGPRHKVYSRRELVPAGTKVSRYLKSEDLKRISLIYRCGVVDLRDFRPWHSLSEGNASALVAQKMVGMRRTLSHWRLCHPRNWQLEADKILPVLLAGDKKSTSDWIRIASRHARPPFLVLNGHRRLAALSLLAVLGEIPLDWLRRIPVWQHVIWKEASLRSLTRGTRLEIKEVFTEIQVDGRSPVEALGSLDVLPKRSAHFEPWETAVGWNRGLGYSEVTDLMEEGLLRDPYRAFQTLLEAAAKAGRCPPILSSWLSERPELAPLVWSRCGASLKRIRPFLETLSSLDPMGTSAYLAVRLDCEIKQDRDVLIELDPRALAQEPLAPYWEGLLHLDPPYCLAAAKAAFYDNTPERRMAFLHGGHADRLLPEGENDIYPIISKCIAEDLKTQEAIRQFILALPSEHLRLLAIDRIDNFRRWERCNDSYRDVHKASLRVKLLAKENSPSVRAILLQELEHDLLRIICRYKDQGGTISWAQMATDTAQGTAPYSPFLNARECRILARACRMLADFQGAPLENI